MATLVVTGDPRQVMADLERQADLLGLPFLTAGGAPPFSCGGFDGDDFAGSLDLDSGDPSDVEGFRCGAVAANDASTASLHVDLLRLTWPGDVAASHLFLRYVTEGPSPDWAGGLPVRNDRAPLRVPEQWPVLAVEGQQVAPWPPLDVVTVEPGSLLVAPPRLDELFSAGDAMIRITADRGAVIDAYQRQFQKITGSAPSMDTSLVVPGGQVRRWHHTGAGGHSIDAYVFGTEPSWLYISVTDDESVDGRMRNHRDPPSAPVSGPHPDPMVGSGTHRSRRADRRPDRAHRVQRVNRSTSAATGSSERVAQRR